MKIVNNQISNNYDIIKQQDKNNDINNDFKTILENEIEKSTVQFSKHAYQRLNLRQIVLSNEQMQRVQDGIITAKDKGINETLILVDDIALLISTKNNIVVTAMKDNKNRVFTNIDGAVIV